MSSAIPDEDSAVGDQFLGSLGHNFQLVPRKYSRPRPMSDEEMEQKRIIANVQERRRMRKLNEALDQLRNVIPKHLHQQYRKLSKIKTLKLAIGYIEYLDKELMRSGYNPVTAKNQIPQVIQSRDKPCAYDEDQYPQFNNHYYNNNHFQ